MAAHPNRIWVAGRTRSLSNGKIMTKRGLVSKPRTARGWSSKFTPNPLLGIKSLFSLHPPRLPSSVTLPHHPSTLNHRSRDAGFPLGGILLLSSLSHDFGNLWHCIQLCSKPGTPAIQLSPGLNGTGRTSRKYLKNKNTLEKIGERKPHL